MIKGLHIYGTPLAGFTREDIQWLEEHGCDNIICYQETSLLAAENDEGHHANKIFTAMYRKAMKHPEAIPTVIERYVNDRVKALIDEYGIQERITDDDVYATLSYMVDTQDQPYLWQYPQLYEYTSPQYIQTQLSVGTTIEQLVIPTDISFTKYNNISWAIKVMEQMVPDTSIDDLISELLPIAEHIDEVLHMVNQKRCQSMYPGENFKMGITEKWLQHMELHNVDRTTYQDDGNIEYPQIKNKQIRETIIDIIERTGEYADHINYMPILDEMLDVLDNPST